MPLQVPSMTHRNEEPPFGGRIGTSYRDSTPYWPPEATSAGRPNVIFLVLDDIGFSSLGCYGSEIATPAIDTLAARGVQFTNFHATALCSPTRASLLTGRNHHAVGMAYLSHVDDGYPGYRGRIGHDSATLAEMLLGEGYNTMAVGKWHLAPIDQTTAAGPYDQWPLGRGFERYYGFLEALADHYYPELFADNHPVPPPETPENGYHLTTDLIDRSCAYLREQTSISPEKPFFLYLAFGATHCPFQAPGEFINRYRGRYDAGWDKIREQRYVRQLAEGIIPAGTKLPPRNDDVRPWHELSADERRLAARFQEVYAGFLEHTDAEIGRLIDYLQQLGRLDDTIVVLLGDNGASQEGGPHGMLDTTQYENGHFPTLEQNLARIDEIDGRTAHINYPLGWAQAANTPLKRYKQNTHAGGIRTAMIMALPHAQAAGERREGFQHVTDIVPTVLDLVGVKPPQLRRGVAQRTLDGISMLPAVNDPAARPGRRTQYFETDGHRALWKDGWKAVAWHRRGTDFETDVWELYHVDEDFSEADNLGAAEPDRLADLVATWWDEARRNLVLPLDDRGFAERANASFRPHSPKDRSTFIYLNDIQHIPTGAAAPVAGRSVQITAHVDRASDEANGVLIAHGSRSSGYALMIADSYLVYDYNYYGSHQIVRSTDPVGLGPVEVAMRFVIDTDCSAGVATLMINGRECGQLRLAETFENFVAFQGMDIGADRLSPVRADAKGEFPFTGELHQVRVDLLDHIVRRGHQPLD